MGYNIIGENMFCGNCGNELKNEDKFCPYCGKQNPLYVETNAKEKNNTINKTTAIIGLVFSLIFPIVGLIIGIIGWSSFSGESKTISKIGTIIGIVLASIEVLYLILFLNVIKGFY